jgi:hypothetical protein
MRFAIVVACIVVFAAVAAADMTGAYVSLVAPTEVVPGHTYTFIFWVWNGSADGELLSNVQVSFPDGYTLFPETMGYDFIQPGRPDWDMTVPPIDHTALWTDGNGGSGEVWASEGTQIYIDVTVADVLYGIPLFWCVEGDSIDAAEPHEYCGCIDMTTSPVEASSWASIKTLYR